MTEILRVLVLPVLGGFIVGHLLGRAFASRHRRGRYCPKVARVLARQAPWEIDVDNEVDNPEPYRPRIRVNDSGSITWENPIEYFASPEGQEKLRRMKQFAQEQIRLHRKQPNQ